MFSIGVDIGTSTTEIIVSNIRITTELGHSFLPVTRIEGAEIVYRSPVSFTPLLNSNSIDLSEIQEKVRISLEKSGIPKEKIETGAVIITGESARKENASRITTVLSEYLGDFVVAAAGPKLEAVLAGRGAGISQKSKERNKIIINLDIGGGTLNAAVFDCGVSQESFALDIGGRLIKISKEMDVTYISDRIQFIIDSKKLPVVLYEKTTWQTLERFCAYMADYCLQACGLKKMSEEAKRLYITEVFTPGNIDFISVSGGVGEFVEDAEMLTDNERIYDKALEFGDIGPILGKKISEAFVPFKNKLIIPQERIRATVIGAGSHTMSLSGSTIGFDETILPIRNIPIVKSAVTSDNWCNLFLETKSRMEMYEDNVIALSIIGKASPGYEELRVLAEQIAKLYGDRLSPVIVLLKEDFAKALSQMIRIQTNCIKPIVCLDNINCEQGDYIDIGTPVGSAVPVVIKTLIYQS